MARLPSPGIDDQPVVQQVRIQKSFVSMCRISLRGERERQDDSKAITRPDCGEDFTLPDCGRIYLKYLIDMHQVNSNLLYSSNIYLHI